MDYALLVANACKAVAESNVTISKVVSGSNRYLVYQYTTVGSDLFFTPYQVTSSEYVVVAGGGGGGGSVNGQFAGGGGGGGGVANGVFDLVQGASLNLFVGAGGALGATSTDNGLDGANTEIRNILTGGGGGGGYSGSNIVGNVGNNGIGGSQFSAGGGGGGAGGAINANFTSLGGLGTQRNGGTGSGDGSSETNVGGSGGGATGNGTGGTGGGAGFTSNITGTSIIYGKGAGSYGANSTIPGSGSSGNYYARFGTSDMPGANGAVILRYLVGNETNHIVTDGLSIGNTGNTGNVTNTSTVNLTGPITLHGTNLNINATLTSTNSDINLHAITAATQTAALTSIGLGVHGTGTFTLTNTSNNVVNFAGGNNTSQPTAISFTDASGGLALGTVGTLTGTVSLGNILIETLAGNITVSENITTTSTSSNAIVLNAGKNTSIGTLIGGDIILTGTPLITSGTNGIVKLFSGDPSTSTGLVNFAGGISNTYFLVDETTSSFSPSLVAGNLYALFRGNPPTVSVTGTITPFVICTGATSNEQTIIVAGINLTANVIVSAPTGYEISLTAGSGFTNAITLTRSGVSVSNTNIYVRLKADAINGAFGNITVASTGATTQNKATGTATIASIPAAPATTASINYTTGDTPSVLAATALTSHTLQWYTASTGGTATTTAFTPTTNTAGTQNYFVSQVNNAGCESTRAQITVTIAAPINTLQAPGGLTYSSTTNVYTVGTAITVLNPTATGGAIASYIVSPTLPAGLTINSSTGVISGTPSSTSSQTTYTITATNASGTATTTVDIMVNSAPPTGLTYPITSSVYTAGTAINILNPIATGGAITTFSVSPTLPAGLTINPTTGVISGIPSAKVSQKTYIITGTSASGTVTATVDITVNDTPEILFSNISKTYGDDPFSVAATSNSDGTKSYSISNTAVATITNNIVTIVGVGTTTISITQAPGEGFNGGTASAILTVGKASLTITADDASRCFAATDPTLSYKVAGYVNGDDAKVFTTKPTVATEAVSSSVAGDYKIVASGAVTNNYDIVYVDGKLTVNPLPVGTVTSNVDYVCDGAILTLNATGGANYVWYKGGVAIANASTSSVDVNSKGDYNAKLISAFGCEAMSNNTLIIKQYYAPLADFTSLYNCINVPVVITNKSVIATAGTVKYLWDDGAGITSILASPSFTYTTAGTKAIKLTVTPDYCPALKQTVSKTITIEAPAPGIKMPVIDAILYTPTPLQARTFGATYNWKIFTTGVTSLSSLKVADPILTTNAEAMFNISIMAANGCVTVDTLQARVFKERTIYLPNAFTPNDDGVNDIFKINPIGVSSLNYFRIFNQWGQQIFETRNLSEGWDSKLNGVRQPMATYTWILDAVDTYGNIIRQSGSVTLIR